MALPLENVRVLDLSRVLAGPYCTMLLGDLGADVIKVERPVAGDDTRHWGPPFAKGESAYYLCCNRNKKSITINLKSEQGRALVARLAAHSDVLVENFLPGTLDGWDLGYETLSQLNPRLVFCSITGFGQTGPLRDEPGYDILIQAMGGVMSITGEPEHPPMKVGVAISDITAGLFASNAIAAALYSRERTGRGERIDIALYDSTIAWLANVGSNYLVAGDVPQRLGTAHPSIVPYQAFAAADRSIIVAVGNDAQFVAFCSVLGRPDIATDVRFQTNAARVEHRKLLVPILGALIAQRPAKEWLTRFRQVSVPAGPVNSIDQVFQDPQTQAREMVMTVDHPIIGPLKLAGSPLKMKSIHETPRRPPPLLGQHTGDVLTQWLGLPQIELETLRSEGVI